jgi:hypothetical protein
VTTLDNGEAQYANSFTTDAMPNPTASLIITQDQHDVKRLVLHFSVEDPDNPGQFLVDEASDRVAFRQVDSGYEEE